LTLKAGCLGQSSTHDSLATRMGLQTFLHQLPYHLWKTKGPAAL